VAENNDNDDRGDMKDYDKERGDMKNKDEREERVKMTSNNNKERGKMTTTIEEMRERRYVL